MINGRLRHRDGDGDDVEVGLARGRPPRGALHHIHPEIDRWGMESRWCYSLRLRNPNHTKSSRPREQSSQFHRKRP